MRFWSQKSCFYIEKNCLNFKQKMFAEMHIKLKTEICHNNPSLTIYQLPVTSILDPPVLSCSNLSPWQGIRHFKVKLTLVTLWNKQIK